VAGLSQPTSFLLSKLRYQRDYLWEVVLPDIGIGINVFGLMGFAMGQLVQSVSFGDYSITNPSSMRLGAFQASFANLLEVPPVTITFLKTMPDTVSAYFNSWKNLIVDKQGLFSPKNEYQKNIHIRFVDQSGIALGWYKLIGCFPITFPKYDLGYAKEEVTKVEIVFKVDKIEYLWF
jgi:hypothetical protein